MTQNKLNRSLGTTHLVLYGLGVTIGAGIYVLIGATTAKAGLFAPTSFLIASFVMAFTACSFAELVGRLPFSAGEAAYVKSGFQSNLLALIVGLMVMSAGILSAATISIGSAGYIKQFVALPNQLIIILILLVIGGVSAWGITQSVLLAGLFTLIEIFGLIFIIGAGFSEDINILTKLSAVFPTLDKPEVWAGVMGAGLLAFFAFIGFEDIVNIAEETKSPGKTIPLAILLTLIITTTIYFLIAAISVIAVGPDALANSDAPLTLVFEKVTGLSPISITLIAIIATLNGIIVQIIMASRVMYGLAKQNNLPHIFSKINSTTKTPLIATVFVIFIILMLALFFPLNALAEMTSRVTLIVFILVNIALVRIKLRKDPAPKDIFVCPIWVPIIGAVVSGAFLIFEFL